MMHFYKHSRDTYELVSRYEGLRKDGQKIDLGESAFVKLIDYFDREESFDRALEAANLGISHYKFSPELHTRKALLLLDNKQEDLALESLDRAEIFGQSFVETDLLRARAYCFMGDHEIAHSILEDLKLNYFTVREESSRICLEEAIIYEKMEEFDKMFYALENSLDHNPLNKEALERMWVAVELTKNHERSVEIHNKVLDENPYSYLAWFNLGHAHYSLREYELSLDAFEYAFITNEKFEPAYKEFAEVCFHLQRHDKALDALEEALAFFDTDSDLLLKIGECYEYQGNFAKAKIFLYRALNLNHSDDEIYYHIAQCYTKEKEYASALHFYKQAIKIDERREDYQVGLANAFYHTGQYQKALPLYQLATEIGPELSINWVQYARFLVNIEGLEEALEVILEAEEYAFGADLFYCKAAILFKLDNRSVALEALSIALTENFGEKNMFFEFLPECQNDKDIKAIMKYYEAEV